VCDLLPMPLPCACFFFLLNSFLYFLLGFRIERGKKKSINNKKKIKIKKEETTTLKCFCCYSFSIRSGHWAVLKFNFFVCFFLLCVCVCVCVCVLDFLEKKNYKEKSQMMDLENVSLLGVRQLKLCCSNSHVNMCA